MGLRIKRQLIKVFSIYKIIPQLYSNLTFRFCWTGVCRPSRTSQSSSITSPFSSASISKSMAVRAEPWVSPHAVPTASLACLMYCHPVWWGLNASWTLTISKENHSLISPLSPSQVAMSLASKRRSKLPERSSTCRKPSIHRQEGFQLELWAVSAWFSKLAEPQPGSQTAANIVQGEFDYFVFGLIYLNLKLFA